MAGIPKSTRIIVAHRLDFVANIVWRRKNTLLIISP
jgi:hypothetical protein